MEKTDFQAADESNTPDVDERKGSIHDVDGLGALGYIRRSVRKRMLTLSAITQSFIAIEV